MTSRLARRRADAKRPPRRDAGGRVPKSSGYAMKKSSPTTPLFGTRLLWGVISITGKRLMIRAGYREETKNL